MSKYSRVKLLIAYEEQEGKCYYCGESIYEGCLSGKVPDIDHKVPITEGGTNDNYNLCLSCYSCNRAKGKKTEEEFMIFLKPFLDGICTRKELTEYNKYLESNKKWGIKN